MFANAIVDSCSIQYYIPLPNRTNYGLMRNTVVFNDVSLIGNVYFIYVSLWKEKKLYLEVENK